MSNGKVTTYRNAVVKFNNGYGALLCNHCSTILKTGFDHADIEHYCDKPECKPAPNLSWASVHTTDQDYFG